MCIFILQSTPNLPPAKNQTALLNSFHTPPSGRLMIWCYLFLGRSVQLLQHSNHLIILSSAFQIPNLSLPFLQLPVNCSSSMVSKPIKAGKKKPLKPSFSPCLFMSSSNSLQKEEHFALQRVLGPRKFWV